MIRRKTLCGRLQECDLICAWVSTYYLYQRLLDCFSSWKEWFWVIIFQHILIIKWPQGSIVPCLPGWPTGAFSNMLHLSVPKNISLLQINYVLWCAVVKVGLGWLELVWIKRSFEMCYGVRQHHHGNSKHYANHSYDF